MGKPLKIMHVVRAFETGGLETLVLEACARTAAHHGAPDACVVAMLPGDGLEQRDRYCAVRSVSLNGCVRGGKLAMVSSLVRLFRRERPAVVHVHNFLAQLYAGVAAKWARVPVLVGTKHGAGWPRLCGSYRLAAGAYGLCDRIVAVSRDVQEGFVRVYGLPARRVPVILNGIDTDRFRPGDPSARARRELLGMDGAPLIGAVCRLVELKGIGTLLEAFAALRRALPEARLAVVGDGADRGTFERSAQRLGVAPYVCFTGTRTGVESIYPLFDMFVLPSYTEGISLTLLEASSCALPVVATRVGGNSEILLEGETGLLVPPRDADALADAMRRIWRNQGKAKAMGRAARERVVKRFSLDRMVDDYLELYGELYARKIPERRFTVGDRNEERVCSPAEAPMTER
jgi:glycosyltransferase involved in cell wall biosynthesis